MGKGLITVWSQLQNWPLWALFGFQTFAQMLSCKCRRSGGLGVLLSPLTAMVLVEFALGIVNPSWGLYRSYLYVLSPLSPPVSDPGVRLQDFQVSQPCQKDWETHGPSTFSPNQAPWGADVSCWRAIGKGRAFMPAFLTPTHPLMCTSTKFWSHAGGYPASSQFSPPTK